MTNDEGSVEGSGLNGRVTTMKRMLLCCALGLAFVATPVRSEEKKEEKKDTAAASEPTANAPKEVAVFKTSEGEMVAEFWSDVAPNTVENFKKLAKSGFYDGTAFHRIIKGFMAQGGDPLTKDASKESVWGSGDPGYKIKAEFNQKKHDRGVLSMARSADPDSAGSQFFLCFGPATSLDGKYTTFGKIIKGDAVLDKLANVPVTRNNAGENSKPVNRVALESVKIVPADSVK
jgi:peptidyl-prolyl cis-trans isomerase B (cyclophilin B)